MTWSTCLALEERSRTALPMTKPGDDASEGEHVTDYTSHVTRHTSHVTRHTSHDTRHLEKNTTREQPRTGISSNPCQVPCIETAAASYIRKIWGGCAKVLGSCCRWWSNRMGRTSLLAINDNATGKACVYCLLKNIGFKV